MKLITVFFAFTFLFSISISAQNWIPIHEDDVYHYELVGDTMAYDSISTDIGYFRNNSPVDATIWIDSVEVATGQTTYHFNKIVAKCDTCEATPYEEPFYLRNQPQFLLNQMIAFDDGTYTLVGENEWHIQPEAALGEGWIFDAANGVNAEVVSTFDGEIFGLNDSLKHIALSSGDTILLSKTHGVIEFPYFQNEYHNLIGIQTRDLGVKIPGFEEMYNFNVGDIFQYSYGAGGIQGGFYGKAKITVLDRADYEDSIVYAIRRIDYKLSYYYSQYYDQITDGEWMTDDTTMHTFYRSDIADIYPGQLFNADRYCLANEQPHKNDIWDGSHVGCLEPQQEEMHDLNQVFYGQNDEGRWVKFMASNDWVPVQMYSNLQAVLDINSDILELGVCFEPYYRVWEEGLGETDLHHWCFEGVYGRSLSGYIIDGDTTGTITSDSVLLITNLEEIINDKTYNITLHPNPTTDQLHFNIQSPKAIQELEVTIYDAMGKVLISIGLGVESLDAIDVSQLPQGVYLISFRMEDGILSRRFIKN